MTTLPQSDDRCACGTERLYAGRVSRESGKATHGADRCTPHQWPATFSCTGCQWTYWIVGDDPAAVLAEWGTCPDCNGRTTLRTRLGASGSNPPKAVVGGLAASGDQSPGATDAPVAALEHRDGASVLTRRPGFLSRALSGVPAFVRRRAAVSW